MLSSFLERGLCEGHRVLYKETFGPQVNSGTGQTHKKSKIITHSDSLTLAYSLKKNDRKVCRGVRVCV